MNCHHCGGSIVSEAKFCTNCGAALETNTLPDFNITANNIIPAIGGIMIIISFFLPCFGTDYSVRFDGTNIISQSGYQFFSGELSFKINRILSGVKTVGRYDGFTIESLRSIWTYVFLLGGVLIPIGGAIMTIFSYMREKRKALITSIMTGIFGFNVLIFFLTHKSYHVSFKIGSFIMLCSLLVSIVFILKQHSGKSV